MAKPNIYQKETITFHKFVSCYFPSPPLPSPPLPSPPLPSPPPFFLMYKAISGRLSLPANVYSGRGVTINADTFQIDPVGVVTADSMVHPLLPSSPPPLLPYARTHTHTYIHVYILAYACTHMNIQGYPATKGPSPASAISLSGHASSGEHTSAVGNFMVCISLPDSSPSISCRLFTPSLSLPLVFF